jgi:hypothetical protein
MYLVQVGFVIVSFDPLNLAIEIIVIIGGNTVAESIPSSLLISMIGGYENFRFLQLVQRVQECEAQLRKYEDPYTLPSNRQSVMDESQILGDSDADGETPSRGEGSNIEWQTVIVQTEKLRLDVSV